MICSKCKKRPAVLFVQRMENGKAVNEGLCWVCAKEAGLPQISDIMNQMGITEDEMEAMSQQLMEFTCARLTGQDVEALFEMDVCFLDNCNIFDLQAAQHSFTPAFISARYDGSVPNRWSLRPAPNGLR